MAHPFDLAPLIGATTTGSALRRGEAIALDDDGCMRVSVPGLDQPLRCEVLHPETPGAMVSGGDAVLVWLEGGDRGVILGRIGPARAASPAVTEAAAFAARPKTLVLEAQGDIVLRNGHSRLRLGENGDVEIVCNSFATRSQRLLRLLSPLIKFN
ncbi:hypothetical protein [Mitsuaria sp. 7]|uniref:hypothetical protein n=1 Tax=Mitsuaria sp. 7 TaxID=1658665 RepID=UPI0007DDFB2A|nr:hypothetical protein [Mitsuaria sp. 7]ANH67320.1 hypothetical protein ABE85_06610 [Mitsuaria sp. 7]